LTRGEPWDGLDRHHSRESVVGLVSRHFWILVLGFTALGVVSLALNIGGPAAVAGILVGMLLMWKAGQRDPV